MPLSLPPYESFSDNELVRLSLEDVDFFYYLMQRYEPKLLAYMRRMANFNDDEEDVLQDIFIKMYQNLNSFDDTLKFSSWIYRIAHNEIINHYYRRKSRPEMTAGLATDEDARIFSELLHDESVHDLYVLRDQAERVRKALADLPIKYREVLILRYFEDKDYNEISDILRKPPGTVATLLNRAKTSFRIIAARHHLVGGETDAP